jgi:hypothetical protein
MRRFVALALAGAIGVGIVSFATADESVQKEQAKFKPTKLSKKKPQNIRFTNTITTFDLAGTDQPPKGERTIVDFPKQFKFNYRKFPYCKTDAAGLETAATTEDAIAACGKGSVVSDPKGSTARVKVGGAGLILDILVTAFNDKNKVLLLYAKPIGDASGIPATILVGKLKPFKKVKGRPPGTGSGPYKESLDVTIPPLAAGAIEFFEVTIKKSKYVQAKCKPKKMKWQATTFFSDGTPPTADTDTAKCKPKKK